MHVTDLHCGYDNVKRLKERLKEEQLKFDMVLISGDVANMPLDQYHMAPKELLQEHHDNLVRITEDFLSVAERVYFVPGNVSGCTLTLFHPSDWKPSVCQYKADLWTCNLNTPFNHDVMIGCICISVHCLLSPW